MNRVRRGYLLLVVTLLAAGCAPGQMPRPQAATPTMWAATAPAVTPHAPTTRPILTPTAIQGGLNGLSAEEIAALESLRKVDDYPLYTMTYAGAIENGSAQGETRSTAGRGSAPWACALFATLADPDSGLYGRNFDWSYSPALLLFTYPPDGYASVSMVDMAYLEVSTGALTAAPLEQRTGLLEAPYLPFDGMNAQGLAVGMAAVPRTNMPDDPDKPTVDNLGIMRQVLDHARTVDEAVAIFESYNVFMEEVPIHYLIADAQGQAAVVEFYAGEMVVIPNAQPYHLATNFLLAEAGESPGGWCRRYDRIEETLGGNGGRLSVEGALGLLAEVSQDITQWSVVYGLHSGEVHVALGGDYEQAHTFKLEAGGQ